MLVLSRKTKERILLPGIGASIEIVDIRSDRVRLGFTAPAGVKILREELQARGAEAEVPAHPGIEAAQAFLNQQRHQIRNHLNFASVGIALIQRQLEAGLLDDVATTLNKLGHGFEQLTKQVEDVLGPAPKAAVKPPHHRLKALLVEDDSNECELLAGFFRLAGYEVATAGDGNDALDYLHGHETPDVMLLDMMLPRCDGPTTVKLVRRDPALSRLKIFAISGYTPEQIGMDCKSAGVDRWFQKPLNPEALLRELSATQTGSISA
jgi:carbon storage regulator CsrA